MPLEKLIARMEQRDTPDTPCNAGGVSREALCSRACTPETPDTPATDEYLAREGERRQSNWFGGRRYRAAWDAPALRTHDNNQICLTISFSMSA